MPLIKFAFPNHKNSLFLQKSIIFEKLIIYTEFLLVSYDLYTDPNH